MSYPAIGIIKWAVGLVPFFDLIVRQYLVPTLQTPLIKGALGVLSEPAVVNSLRDHFSISLSQLTPGISGAHGTPMMKDLLIARPLHAVIGRRLRLLKCLNASFPTSLHDFILKPQVCFSGFLIDSELRLPFIFAITHYYNQNSSAAGDERDNNPTDKEG